ncbi:hypothetical protein EMIHUDRAFT_468023 [Emiliania huxleyi CCMP1516]|uniref:FAD-binding domain-containing protein n=2 Tax=Emiliania huxleyi TaxID=2903 RepID=A0A0D3K9G4_EMIH1|nr:hypothetical protein EMIHUDRAFT_468023 [Emiliania huxleyi CCMP1516]EOD32399.1 hypothetical protein EMIHUDRAFT_468023 [Emiliania huxleyi CCMP1516]|eukprot:XP_005784828.1 hypothetical protein EMIHUDRAFT_468023 [Emiliania huxleyi CCMP1516]
MNLPSPSLLLLLLLATPAAALRAGVIGGGLGGLACCNALRKVGIEAEVFERAPKLSPQAGTGLTLWPNGLSALEAIDPGLSAHVLRAGSTTQHIEVTSADGLTKLPNPTGDPRRFPSTYGHPMANVRWSKLQKVLAARLPEGIIHLDRQLTKVEPAGGGVTAHFERSEGGAESAHFDLLVGADGINSALRQQLVGDGAPRDAGRTIWRSIIPYEERLLQAGSCSMSAGAGKVGFLTHLSEGELYWSAFATDEAIAKSGLVRGDFSSVKEYLVAQFSDVYKLLPVLERTPEEAILERRAETSRDSPRLAEIRRDAPRLAEVRRDSPRRCSSSGGGEPPVLLWPRRPRHMPSTGRRQGSARRRQRQGCHSVGGGRRRGGPASHAARRRLPRDDPVARPRRKHVLRGGVPLGGSPARRDDRRGGGCGSSGLRGCPDGACALDRQAVGRARPDGVRGPRRVHAAAADGAGRHVGHRLQAPRCLSPAPPPGRRASSQE